MGNSGAIGEGIGEGKPDLSGEDWGRYAIPLDRKPRPVLKYYGGKFRLAPWIICFFPRDYPSLHYIEPFGGGGSVLFRKEPSRLETYNDLDSELVNFFRVLRESPGELIESLRLTPFSREEYQLALDAIGNPPGDPIERARLLYVRYWQSISGSPYRPGWGRRSIFNGAFNPHVSLKSVEGLREIANRLRTIQIENRDAFDLIEESDSEVALFYVDPPYVFETRSVREDSYAFELTDSDHVRLAELLNRVTGYVVLSGYGSELYRDLYESRGWIGHSIETQTSGRKMGLEYVWLNPRLAEERAQGDPRPRNTVKAGGSQIGLFS